MSDLKAKQAILSQSTLKIKIIMLRYNTKLFIHNFLWVSLCWYCMNEVRCHVILYAWLIGKEPTRAEYPVQMVGFGQAVSLIRWLLMLDSPFIRNWTAAAFLLFKSKLEGRMYRWKWTGFERMCVCASSLFTSCFTLSQSINSVAVPHLFNQSLPAQHKPSNRIIATHIFFLV